jgi:hypothetical protein
VHRALVRRGEVKSRRGTNVKVGEPPRGVGRSENPEGSNVVGIIYPRLE